MAKHSHEKKEEKHESHVSHASLSSEDEEVKIDFKKVKGFISNKKLFNTYALIAVLVIVAVFFSVYYRAYPAHLPVTEDWARNSAINTVRSNVAAQINQQYPNLPAANKNQLIEEQVNKIFEEQGSQIEQQIQATAEYFKSRHQTDEGQTYLLAIDPYQHLRRAENLLDHGYPSDTIKDGQLYNTHQFAPIGKLVITDMHPYFIFYFYKVLNIFNPGISMLAAAFWAPVFLSALAVIPAFFLVRRRAGVFGGFIAALIVAIHPVFIGRTAAGFSDSDAYVVLFALLIAWFFIEGFETNNLKKKIILTVLAGFFVGLFAFAWTGWWYVFDLIVGLVVIFIGYGILKSIINDGSVKKLVSSKSLRDAAIVLIIFFVCSALFVPLLSTDNIQDAFTGPIIRTKLKVAAHADYWPNIQTTVAELNPISIPGAINQLGGKLLFFIAVLGMVISLVKVDELRKKDYAYLGISLVFLVILLSKSLLNLKPVTYLLLLSLPVVVGFVLLLKDDRKIDMKYAILLMLWFIGSMYASTKGTRFVLLLVPAFGIAVGIALGLVHRMLTKIVSEEFKIKKIIVSLALVVLLCLFLITPMRAANATARNEVPSMNDAWWQSLESIKMNSSEDAIINSWWDFGHWFKYVADRPVTVDGSGQDYQLAHWMGTILISNDEEKAVNTLRMLDCGSKQTYISLLNDTDNVLLAVNLTKTIIMQTEEEARETLEQAGVSQEAVEKTLGYAFCDPPENFLITSEDMVGKAGVWGHFGSWNFERSFVYVTSKNKKQEEVIPVLVKELGITEDQASDYYYDVQGLSSEVEGNAWIAPWPNYFTGAWTNCEIFTKEIPEEEEEEEAEATEANASEPSKAEPLSANDESLSNSTELNETEEEEEEVVEDVEDNVEDNVEDKGVMLCNINKVINKNNQAQVVLERALYDLDNPANSSLIIGSYDISTGFRTGGGDAIPAGFVLYKEDDEIERVEMDNVTFPYDILIDMVNNKTLVSDPLLSQSLFTKLFYLDGRYTNRFEKFSDLNTVTGQRVIIWKVLW